MNQISLSLLLFICLPTFIFSQKSPFTVKADSLREVGELKAAIEQYLKRYEEDSTDRHNTYNLACSYALKRQRKKAFKYLKVAIAKDSTVQALNDPDFYFLIEDERWKTIESELVERIEAKHGKYQDIELSKELWRMKIKDQAFYYHLDIADKKLGWQSPIVSALWELKHKINEKNVERISELIDTQGWPKKSVIKGSAAGTVFLVIQHADIEVQKKYLPLMKEAANNGEASWRSLALLIDRVNLREGKQQIYGSQIHKKADTPYYVADLFEPEYVNQRRKEVGLGPIEDYVKRWGIKWEIEQKEK